MCIVQALGDENKQGLDPATIAIKVRKIKAVLKVVRLFERYVDTTYYKDMFVDYL